MGLNAYEMRELFDQTVVIRQPRFGIVSGYHELPYVCLGQSVESGYATTQVKGRVQVSPRFLIRPSQFEPSYEEIFGEDQVAWSLEAGVRELGPCPAPDLDSENDPHECRYGSAEKAIDSHLNGLLSS